MTTMGRVKRLLAHGFFPREVPQCFVSESYGEAVTADAASIPTDMTGSKRRKPRPLARHNLARVGQLRRPLSVPHPARYFALCSEIVANWDCLRERMERSELSVSRPALTVDDDAERAITTEYGPPDYPKLRARHRRNARYLVYADVQRCYPSIYTHAIAWAVEGKTEAKDNLRKKWSEREDLLGDRLDAHSRKMQDSQSLGIPIGPDTSHILADVLLSAVDFDFQEGMGRPIRGFRAVDDYELSFSARSDAERALARLQSVLLRYELQLNERKTRIVELPDALKDSWPVRLRNVPIRSGRRQADDLLTLFSLAFELVGTYRDKSVLRYAIAMANGTEIAEESWSVYQDILLQCAASEPGTLRYVTAELMRAREHGLDVDEDGVQELSCYLIEQHTYLGHGSEVAWAIWLAIALGVRLPAKQLEVVAGLDDPFVPVLALYAEERGLIVGGQLDKTRWQGHARNEGLDSSDWLVAYEGAVRGWLPPDTARMVDEHPVFGWFRANDVSFFDHKAPVVGLNRWSRASPYGEAKPEPQSRNQGVHF